MATVVDIIRQSAAYLAEKGVDSPALSARLMAGKALGLDNVGLIREAGRELTDQESGLIDELVRRRGEGEPAAYILGEKEFYGLSMLVGPEVLIPRPETELLVDLARRSFKPESRLLFADLGAGSGCLAVAVAVHFPNALGLALELSPAALGMTVKNARRHGAAERLVPVLADFASPFAAEGSLDLILANPPYVSDSEYAALSPEVFRYEPRTALRGGSDGCEPGLKLLAAAAPALKPGGMFAMEIGASQARRFTSAISAFEYSFKKVDTVTDLSGIERVVFAVKQD